MTSKADVLVLLCGDVSDPYTSYDLTWYLDMWLLSEYDMIIQNKHANNQEQQAVQKLSTDDSSAAEMRCSVNFVPCLQTLLNLLVDTISNQTDTPCHCLGPWSTVNQQNCYSVLQQHQPCICYSKSERLMFRAKQPGCTQRYQSALHLFPLEDRCRIQSAVYSALDLESRFFDHCSRANFIGEAIFMWLL